MDWVHLAYNIIQWKSRVIMSNLGSVTGGELWHQLSGFSSRDVLSCHVPASTLSLKKVMSVRELALHASGLIITTLSECTASCSKSEVLLVTAVPSWGTAVSSTQQLILMQLQSQIFLLLVSSPSSLLLCQIQEQFFSTPLAAKGCRESKEGCVRWHRRGPIHRQSTLIPWAFFDPTLLCTHIRK